MWWQQVGRVCAMLPGVRHVRRHAAWLAPVAAVCGYALILFLPVQTAALFCGVVPVAAVAWYHGPGWGAVAGMCAALLGWACTQGLAVPDVAAAAGALPFVGVVVGRCASRTSAAHPDLAMQNFLENVLESSIDSILITDANGFVIRANQAFADMVGYSREQIIGKGMYQFFLEGAGTYTSTTGEEVAIDEAFFVAAADRIDALMTEGRLSNWESYYVNSRQMVIPVEQNAVLLRDRAGRRIGSVGIIRDITQRRKAEQQLRETSQTLLALIQAAPLAIIVCDQADRVLVWNPAAASMFGWDAAQVVGNPVPFAGDGEAGNVRELFARGQCASGVRDQELRCRTRDGAWVDVLFSAAPLDTRTRDGAAAVAVMSDITEQKRLQQEILDVSGFEQQRIGQDLHDGLGQVLTGVTFLGRALEQKLSARQMPEAQDAAEITRLVNEAKAQTRRLARGLFPITLEADGLMAALGELAAATENLFNITCLFSYNQVVPIEKSMTALHLYRITQEAITNAIRHGAADSIVISLEAENGQGQLRIADNGAGFSGDPAGAGGMGIRLMHYRARMIGGTLQVAADPEGGATVVCSFPLQHDSMTGAMTDDETGSDS